MSTRAGSSIERQRIGGFVDLAEAEAQGWNPDLVRRLHELACSGELQNGRLDTELRALELKYESTVYSALIFLLSHVCLPPPAARWHWQQIRAHRDLMQRRLSAQVDLRVALASYFVNVSGLLKNPKIIEMQAYEQARELAYRDALTGARNFRFFSETLNTEVARSEQYNAPLSLVMLDLDDFKVYNDRHGHAEGNKALVAVARLLAGRLRTVDVLVRYGGEEFTLILPSTPKAAAAEVAERARRAVEGQTFATGRSGDVAHLTVSVGVATCPADADSAEDLVNNADAALYEAKKNGKNQVRIYANSLRSYRRLCESLQGTFRMGATDYGPLTTLNVSVGGMLFRTRREPPLGSLIEIKLGLPDSRGEITTAGRVVHVTPCSDGEQEVAMRTVEMGAADRWALAKYLRRRESQAHGSA